MGGTHPARALMTCVIGDKGGDLGFEIAGQQVTASDSSADFVGVGGPHEGSGVIVGFPKCLSANMLILWSRL